MLVLMIITDGCTSMWSHTLLPFSSLTTSIQYFVNEVYMFTLSTLLITSLDKVIFMVTKLWRGKTTYEGCKTSEGYEASEPSFQP